MLLLTSVHQDESADTSALNGQLQCSLTAAQFFLSSALLTFILPPAVVGGNLLYFKHLSDALLLQASCCDLL